MNVSAGWHSPAEDSPESEPVNSSVLWQQFTLRLKHFTRIGFAGIGWFLFLVIDFSVVSIAERSAVIIVTLAAMGMGIVYLRMGKVSGGKQTGNRCVWFPGSDVPQNFR